MGKKNGKKKKTAFGKKQSISQKELSYLRKSVESSIIAFFLIIRFQGGAGGEVGGGVEKDG